MRYCKTEYEKKKNIVVAADNVLAIGKSSIYKMMLTGELD